MGAVDHSATDRKDACVGMCLERGDDFLGVAKLVPRRRECLVDDRDLVRMDGELVRPHDLTISLEPQEGATEAVITRMVHLGFEVRVEVELADKTQARAQLTRAQAGELELAQGATVYVKVPHNDREKLRV